MKMDEFKFKLMNFVFKMMDFELKMMHFVGENAPGRQALVRMDALRNTQYII